MIDYNKVNFVDVIRKAEPEGIDLVFATVGGETLQQSTKVIKNKGALVSIVEPVDHLQTPQLRALYHFVEPNAKQLSEIGALFDKKVLIPPNLAEYPFEKISEALKFIQKGHTKGKIVLKILA